MRHTYERARAAADLVLGAHAGMPTCVDCLPSVFFALLPALLSELAQDSAACVRKND